MKSSGRDDQTSDASDRLSEDRADGAAYRRLASSRIDARRHPGAQPLRVHRAPSRIGEVRRLLLRRSVRPLRHPRRQLRRLPAARRADQLPRSDRGAAGDGGGDAPSWPRRHALDQLPLGLSPGALARLARRHEQGPRGVERRDLGDRSRGPECRPRRAAAARAALRPRRRGSGGLLRAVERLGRERLRARQEGGRARRPVEGALRELRGPLDQDARAALHPAQPAGPSRHHAGRQLRSRPRVRRALGRGDLHHPARPGRDGRVLHRHQDAHAGAWPRARANAPSCPASPWCWARPNRSPASGPTISTA